ncbi:unnamed protein product [Gordionus sp. m RMFG-2023]|uniref:small ribosomal subunit protein eS19-like n=1 Tax=Gordionus sp. m RMFG-2023 TaxID=3053472 RepID=UPI0030E3B99C
MPGISAKDVDQQKFVIELSDHLKKSGKIKLPEFVDHVKLAKHNELAPINDDWFYIRAASMARHLYNRPAGVGSFTKIYGARKNNGVKPSHFSRGSACISRKILQSLEQMNLVELDKVKGGRKLTSQGRKDLDRIANQIHKKIDKILDEETS